jgi:predicted N-acetyltransferase YhbS
MIRTRQVEETDLADVVNLWEELRGAGGRLGPFGPPASTTAVRERLSVLAQDSSHRVIVAEVDDQIVGLAVLSRLPVTPISEVESVQISFMHVRNDRRRRGVGRAIVESAADFANEVGADYVTVGVFPGSRDTNRYFARLGFTPLVVRRAIATSLLQRRLGGDQGIRDVLHRRRRSKTRD